MTAKYRKMIKDLLLYFALLLWFVVPSQAQPTIFMFAEDTTAKQGETIDIPIKVEDFEEVIAWQFTFEWDSLVLEFVDIVDFNLTNLSEYNFGPSDIRGYIVSTWFESSLIPTTLPDGETVFKIRFNVIGDPTEESNLWFSGSELPNIASVDGQEVEIISEPGMFVVEEVPNATISVPDNFNFSITPNPFTNNTQINFNLDKRYDDLSVSIYTTEGKLIYQHIEDRGAGNHIIDINANELPNSGMYFLQLVSEGLHTTHKLILQNH